jgi:23S rRNA pseudouridine955/2504/2580 synthase
MSQVQVMNVSRADHGARLDRWFAKHFPHVSRVMLFKLCRTGQVRVEGGRVKPDQRLEEGQAIRVPPLPDPQSPPPARVEMPRADKAALRDLILFEDAHLVALNKPAGLAVQGGSGTSRHLDQMVRGVWGHEDAPRLAHRLDRDTSGVLVFSKTAEAAALLGKAFQQHRVDKTYFALVLGRPRPRQGEIKGYLKKAAGGAKGRETMVTTQHGDPDGQFARTQFQTLQNAGQRASLIALRPLTGRTHQLRVHMALAGHAILGDRKYVCDIPTPGSLSAILHLHAGRLDLQHPVTGRALSIAAPFPAHMLVSFAALGLEPPDPAQEPENDSWN